MKRPYIAGPVTGVPEGNLPAFTHAEKTLRDAGFDPLNPRNNGAEGEATWLDYMRMSLRQIADCDGIVILPGWERSRGAAIEVELAQALGLPVLRLNEWIEAYG